MCVLNRHRKCGRENSRVSVLDVLVCVYDVCVYDVWVYDVWVYDVWVYDVWVYDVRVSLSTNI